MISACPALTPMATPNGVTLAMAGLLEVQVSSRVDTGRLLWLGTTTGTVSCSPGASDSTSTLKAKGEEATATVARATRPVAVRASTTPCPAEMPTTLPSGLTLATVSLSDRQVTGIIGAGDPSPWRKVMLSRTSSDGSSVTELGSMRRATAVLAPAGMPA